MLRRGRYLNFARCSQLADVSALGSAVGNLQELTSLHLDFGYWEQLADVSALGSAVGNLRALTSLHLNFERWPRRLASGRLRPWLSAGKPAALNEAGRCPLRCACRRGLTLT